LPWLGDAGLLPGGVEDVESLLRRISHRRGGAAIVRGRLAIARKRKRSAVQFSDWDSRPDRYDCSNNS
jgi:hypothetical protein